MYLIAGLVGAMFGISPIMDLRYFTGFNGFLILPALYVTIAIHELGHLVAGRTVGMRSGAIMIAGVVIFKSGAHWGIRFDHRCMFLRTLGMDSHPFLDSATYHRVATSPVFQKDVRRCSALAINAKTRSDKTMDGIVGTAGRRNLRGAAP